MHWILCIISKLYLQVPNWNHGHDLGFWDPCDFWQVCCAVVVVFLSFVFLLFFKFRGSSSSAVPAEAKHSFRGSAEGPSENWSRSAPLGLSVLSGFPVGTHGHVGNQTICFQGVTLRNLVS